jgi:SPP1 gp7 family putative phage head morphogenesis protein
MKNKIVLRRKTPLSALKVQARKALLSLLSPIFERIKNELIPKLRATQREYTGDNWADEIENEINQVTQIWNAENPVVNRLADVVMKGVLRKADETIRADVKNRIGLDIFFNNSKLQDLLKVKTLEFGKLITNMGDDHITKISGIVSRGVTTGARAEEIAKEIFEVTKMTERRAQLIAIDQIQKANGVISQQRKEQLSDEYIWRNMDDRKVRGNPNGLYPKVKYSHWDREGKTYKWSDPPPDGHPGKAVKCRCIAEAVINLEKLLG